MSSYTKEMPGYALITDTSSNLPLSHLGGALDPVKDPMGRGIYVVPFIFSDGEKEQTCKDIDAFDGKGFYDEMREGKCFYTSQVTPQVYIDCMTPLLEAGRDILFIGMSSGISGSYNSACMAKEELSEDFPERKIELVDTHAASLGEGLVVLRALMMRNTGVPIEEAREKLLKLSSTMCQIFTVDNLTYLKRTGRVSGVTAAVGSLLNIKPLLKGNEEGKIVTCGKVRGRRKAIEAMAEQFARWTKEKGCPETVGIAHADCEEDCNYLVELLKKVAGGINILKVCYEPVTGSHVGPGALALFFDGDAGFRAEA